MTRAAGALVIAMMLAGCGGGKFGEPAPASAPAGMSWPLDAGGAQCAGPAA